MRLEGVRPPELDDPVSEAEPYAIGITRWEWMKAALLLAIAERNGGHVSAIADQLALPEDAVRNLLSDARRVCPIPSSVANIALETDRWEAMVARMLLAVVEIAPSQPAAGHLLGLTRREIRTAVHNARQIGSRADSNPRSRGA